LNAQENRACRSTLSSGTPAPWAVRAMVTADQGLGDRAAETGARLPHLASKGIRAGLAYQLIISPLVASMGAGQWRATGGKLTLA
jgi:hypothetical protein